MNRLVMIAIGALLCLGLLTSAAPAQSQTIPSYRIVALPSGLTAYDVNDSGQVAGCDPVASPNTPRAVIYSNGNITDLGVGDGSCAYVINNKGDVAGLDSAGHVFLWTKNSGIQHLGLPPSTYVPYGIQNIGGINDADQIAGTSYSILGGTEGFIGQPGTGTGSATWIELPPDPVNGVKSIGLNAINSLGDVAGAAGVYSPYVGGYTVGYLRTSNGTASIIRSYPWPSCGAPNPFVIAAAINDSDVVVGSHGGYSCNLPVAFIYTQTAGLSLHDGSAATLESDGIGVTNDGQVLENFLGVDSYGNRSPADSFVYASPGSNAGYYLTQVVRQDCGWIHLAGSRISNGGTPVTPGTITPQNIIGRGVPSSNPQSYQAFLMTPLSSPPQTMADGCTVPPANPKPTAVPHVSQPIVEATGPNGASVTLDGSGSTAPNGGALTYSWTGPFGTVSGINPTVTIPLGTSTIGLTVTDSLGDTGSATIQITVRDTTPPTTTILSQPSAISGMNNGSFYFVGNDLVTPVSGLAYLCTMDQAGPVPCSSPFLFTGLADGPHTFKVQAIDAAGNKDPLGASFAWTVDTTPPVLTIPGNITTQATSVAGAVVNFAASANDAIAGPVPVTCTPPSGSTFAIGTITVNCSATDTAGNTATKSFTVTVSQLSQTISFGPLPNHTYGDADFPLSATASSGLPVTYTVGSNPYCMLIGFTVHIITAGICPITAQQAGNGNYLPAADVTQSLTIAKATQTISFGPLPNHTYGDADFPLSATASSGLPVTYTTGSNPYCMLIGFTVHIITAGICPITAQQAGNGNYLPAADVTQSLTIAKASASVTPNATGKTYGSADPTFTGTLTGFLARDNVTAAYTRNSGEAAGNYTISATLAPAAVLSNYNITYNTAPFTINRAPLTITANNAMKMLNAPLPAFSPSYSGFVNGENASVLTGTVACTATATASSPIGSYPITCSGVTSSNYAITFVAGTLKVMYAPAGVCGHVILPPINADGSTVGKQGRTIPAKFQVCDANGVSIGTPGVVASFYLTEIITGTVTTNVEDIVDTNNPDTAFRWAGDQWIFNITTSNLVAGSTYVYTIMLNDGSTINFQYGLR